MRQPVIVGTLLHVRRDFVPGGRNVTDARQCADITSRIAVLSGFTTLAARKHGSAARPPRHCISAWTGLKRTVLC